MTVCPLHVVATRRPAWSVRAGLLAALLAACGGDDVANDGPTTTSDPGSETGATSTTDAGTWTIGALVGREVGAFMSAWGRAGNDVYAVGGNPGRGVVGHFDGATWQLLETGALPMINWVTGVTDPGAAGLWMAGDEGTVIHYDGAGGWSRTQLTTPAPLWGVHAFADNDVWVVGGDIPGGPAILAHFDGVTWQEHPLPATDRTFDALFKVWGLSADDVWAVGHRGIVLHFDGVRWTQVASGTGEDLISLWGRTPEDVVAVGGRAIATVARWDGNRWQSRRLEQLPGLNGSWMAPDGRTLIAGMEGLIIELDPGSFEYTELDRQARVFTLHAAFGLSEGPRFAIGGTLLGSPPWEGVIVQNLPTARWRN